MASWIDNLLDEPTVLWLPPTRDGLGGYTWGAPFQISGRWQYGFSSMGPKVIYNPDGTGSEIPNRDAVWTNISVEPGSYLYKGLIAGADISLASQVVAIKFVRSVINSYYLYKAFLDAT